MQNAECKMQNYGFFLLLFFFVAVLPPLADNRPVFAEYSGNYCFYISENHAAKIEFCDTADAAALKSKLSGIKGESVSFAGDMQAIDNILKKYAVNIVRREQTGGIVCYYGVSQVLPKGVFIGKEYVNIQVVINSGQVTVGTPIIYAGF